MPETSNGGVRISYEVIGHGRPPVLLHGWASDRTFWIEAGYVEDLRRDHRIVLLDLRGHGASDKPHLPADYGADALTHDVLAVADAEGLDRFATWGLSYGGLSAWLTAEAFPERVPAIIVTGAWDPRPGTYDDDWKAFEARWLAALRRDGTKGLVAAFAAEEHDAFLRDPPTWARDMFLRQDPEALLAIQSPELLPIGVTDLEHFPVPVLSIAGGLEDPDDDSAKVAGRLPNGESLRLPGLGHGDAVAASERALPAARAFLDRWFAGSG